MKESVSITCDGERVAVPAGCTVAVALMNAGMDRLRTSARGLPRGPLCGMGICYECRVSIDGIAQQRACMVTVADGMVVNRDV